MTKRTTTLLGLAAAAGLALLVMRPLAAAGGFRGFSKDGGNYLSMDESMLCTVGVAGADGAVEREPKCKPLGKQKLDLGYMVQRQRRLLSGRLELQLRVEGSTVVIEGLEGKGKVHPILRWDSKQQLAAGVAPVVTWFQRGGVVAIELGGQVTAFDVTASVAAAEKALGPYDPAKRLLMRGGRWTKAKGYCSAGVELVFKPGGKLRALIEQECWGVKSTKKPHGKWRIVDEGQVELVLGNWREQYMLARCGGLGADDVCLTYYGVTLEQ